MVRMDVTPTPGLNQLAADPARAAKVPAHARGAPITQCAAISAALANSELAAPVGRDGQPEAPSEVQGQRARPLLRRRMRPRHL